MLAVGMEPVVVVTDDLDADALATGNLRRRGGSSRVKRRALSRHQTCLAAE